MIYRNQKEFEHIIQQLGNIQNTLQKKIIGHPHPQFYPKPEYPMIDLFQHLGYKITPAHNEIPDEIGYDSNHNPIGFEFIKKPHQSVPHSLLEAAIQKSQAYGKISRSVIVTNGSFNPQDRHWTQATFPEVKLFDVHDLPRFNHPVPRSRTVHRSITRHNYADQKQIIQKLKKQIILKHRREQINRQRADQLKQIIHQIKHFTSVLIKFKDHFKKSAHRRDRFVHHLQKKLARQKQQRAKLQAKQRTQNFRARLRAARNFSHEIISSI